MNFATLLAAARSGAPDPDTLDDLARAALQQGEEEAALEVVLPAAERANSALLWQWAGLLQRSLDEHEHALSAFERAARIAPGDGGIAHGYARTTLEAGLDATELFQIARQLAPNDGWVLLGAAAAKNAIGQGEQAADELRDLLDQWPGWIDGHQHYAQLAATLGQRNRTRETVEVALKRFGRDAELWRALLAIDLQQQDYPALERDIARAGNAGVQASALADYRAIAASELSIETFPRALFDALQAPQSLTLWQVRHLLRVGALDEALPLIESEIASDRAADVYPYAATAWRLTGDLRVQWLEGDLAFVRVIDLSTHLPPLAELAGTLRALHVARGEFLDQSVRGGTQTDGPLLSRIDPSIRILRNAIVRAVEDYVSQLPPADPRHPLLRERRNRRIRFSGSWSVRLRSGGRHSNHVHTHGWISSALYIALPDRTKADRPDAGWLTLGEPDAGLGLDLPPSRKIEPKPGHLILFPSWMWHGTVPFGTGERLTVAFDVRPPI